MLPVVQVRSNQCGLRAPVGANQPSLQVRVETKWINRGKMGHSLKCGLFLHFYVLFLLHLNQTRGSDLWCYNTDPENRPTDMTLTGNNDYNSLNFMSPVFQMFE